MSSPAIPAQFPGSRVLIVEDVLPLSIQYRALLKPLDVQVVVAASVAEAAKQIALGSWDAALVDIHLPDGTGFDVMRTLSERCPHCAVVVVSAEDSMDNAVRAAHAGALDFIEKPVDPDRLQITMRNALQAASLSARVHALEPVSKSGFHSFVGSSPVMQGVYKAIETIAQSRAPVFIHGESGTGKELAAEAIHQCSPRKSRPLVAINCAAIPKELIESELFGHVKGAFTGASADRQGAFLEADGGTLFLDEIAELDVLVQAKLLRALQTGEVRRLGETRPRMVDVRIVCASHRDLYAQVQAGRFREDLFYRLYVVPLELPPLRERGEDIALIARAMLGKYAKEDGKQFSNFSKSAMDAMRAYAWPGNVRELINVIRAAVAMFNAEQVALNMLPPKVQQGRAAAVDSELQALPADASTAWVAAPEVAAQQVGARIKTLALLEREAIENALKVFSGNITQAAIALGVNPSTIHRKKAQWRQGK